MARVRKLLTHPYLMIAVRLFLAVTFLQSGWEKATHLSSFVVIVKAYDILPVWMADVFGRALPFVELLVGAYFLIGLLTRWTAVLTALMMASFMVATVVNLVRGTPLDNCGCTDLTSLTEGFGWHTFYRQLWYMIPVGLAFFGRHTALSVDSLLRRSPEHEVPDENGT